MNWIKRLFDFYINSSTHVALASTALVYLTFLKLGVEGNYDYLWFSFFSAVAGYNFVKYLQISNPYYKPLTRSMKWIRLFTVLCTLGTGYLFFQLASIKLFWTLLPFGVLTILYAIPFLPNHRNLRSIARGKIFIIAIVWAGITVVVPSYFAVDSLSFDFLIEALQRFLFVLVLMFPFEIRDLPYDHKALKTVPQLIGVLKTKVLGSLILFLFLILHYFKDTLKEIEIVSGICISVIMLFFLWKSKKEQTNYYCSFWVESVPIIWLLIFINWANLIG